MTREEAGAVLREVIVRVAPELSADSISDDADLRNDLDLDSMDFLNTVIGVYEHTGVEMPERDYDTVTRFSDFVDDLTTRA